LEALVIYRAVFASKSITGYSSRIDREELPTILQESGSRLYRTGKPSLLRRWGSFLERGSGGANSFGVGRAGETEGSRELGRIEEIGRFVLVEHFIDFAD
jgi:hypothetical protein